MEFSDNLHMTIYFNNELLTDLCHIHTNDKILLPAKFMYVHGMNVSKSFALYMDRSALYSLKVDQQKLPLSKSALYLESSLAT